MKLEENKRDTTRVPSNAGLGWWVGKLWSFFTWPFRSFFSSFHRGKNDVVLNVYRKGDGWYSWLVCWGDNLPGYWSLAFWFCFLLAVGLIVKLVVDVLWIILCLAVRHYYGVEI